MKRRSGIVAGLVLAAGLVARPAPGVVQALPPETRQPRVTATVHSPPGTELRRAAMLPFTDAPRSPGTGEVAAAAFRRALEARGIEVSPTPAPLDASGRAVPAHLVSPAQLVGIGKAVGADAVVTGRALEIQVEQRDRPYVTVRTPGAYVDLPPEVRVRTSASVSVRVLDVARGRVAYEASARYGPAEDLPPEAAVDSLMEALLTPWFSAPAR